MTTPTQVDRRPLLVNGERLRVDVTPSRAGGGDKFEPQSVGTARSTLLPMIRIAQAGGRALPSALRADGRLYIEARLLPNYLAASYFPLDWAACFV